MATRAMPASVVLSNRRARLLATPLRHLDVVLVGASLALSGLGLMMIYSATQARTKQIGLSSLYYVDRQAVWIAFGLVAMVAVMAIDYRKLRDLAPLGYVGMLFLLAAVLVPGIAKAQPASGNRVLRRAR